MTAHGAALLLGLFGAPTFLLFLGHGFRARSRRARRLFWGGVAGHSLGIVAATVAMVAPPVWWAGGGDGRVLVVHWAMLTGFLVGSAAGWWGVRARTRD